MRNIIYDSPIIYLRSIISFKKIDEINNRRKEL